MTTKIVLLVVTVFAWMSLCHDITFSQTGGSIDGASLADLSLKTIASVKPADRRGARSLGAQQIAALLPDQRIAATTRLFERLRQTEVRITRGDIASVLASMPTPWVSANTSSDCQYMYDLYNKESDDTLKSSFDAALANARGLYRDGIADYSSTTPSEFVRAPGKLKAMADNYPASRYAENASFYLGQYYTRAFFLLDVSDKTTLIKQSNTAYESYIAKAESNKFVSRQYFPASYYYRGLNGWILDDLKDARNWLTRGSQKVTDNDNIYIYRIIPNTDTRYIIDDFLPAKSTFTKTLAFLSIAPTPSYSQVELLFKKLREN